MGGFTVMKLLNNQKILLTITVTLFFISAILGLALFSLITPATPEASETVKYYKYDSSWATFLSILSKNAMVCLGLASGIFLLGIPTIIILLLNGFWFGSIMGIQFSTHHSISKVLSTLLIHGIFEIPALLLSGYLGLMGLTFYFTQNKHWTKKIKLFGLICILLIISALVESFISMNFK
ncbi:stage II sporulation protein M [Bacillus cereus]|nr:stage II sporulation protein M [Bacillus cereus]